MRYHQLKQLLSREILTIGDLGYIVHDLKNIMHEQSHNIKRSLYRIFYLMMFFNNKFKMVR